MRLRNTEGDAWEIVYLDTADTDAEAAHRFLAPYIGDTKAGVWLRDFYETTANLVNFPGPYAHPVDEAASRSTGQEVRRMQFRGGTRQKPIGAVYQIYYYTVQTESENERSGIFILRVLHGAAGAWPVTETDAGNG